MSKSTKSPTKTKSTKAPEAKPASIQDKVKEARTANPSLHLLYTGWAVKHILLLNDCMAKLAETSNSNLLAAQSALANAREDLIQTDPAFFEADAILAGIQEYLPKRLRYDRERGTGRLVDTEGSKIDLATLQPIASSDAGFDE